MRERSIGALVVTADGFLISRRNQIIKLAARYVMPAMYPLSQYAAAGGLMSYGANLPDTFLQTGIYVGKILKGAQPADLPVLQPTKIEFVLNLKTAKALGVQVPDKPNCARRRGDRMKRCEFIALPSALMHDVSRLHRRFLAISSRIGCHVCCCL
jgi:ABC-type uncharacterized transport system substrate-binding protein